MNRKFLLGFFILLLIPTALAGDNNDWWINTSEWESTFYTSCSGGDLSNWVESAGTWIEEGGVFKCTSDCSERTITRIIDFNAYTDFNFHVRVKGGFRANFFDADNGYKVNANMGGPELVEILNVGVSPDTPIIAGHFTMDEVDTWYDFNISRSLEGYFFFHIDGNLIGVSDWTDTNFTEGSSIMLTAIGAATTFDDISFITDSNNFAATIDFLTDLNIPLITKKGTDHNLQFRISDVDNNAQDYLINADLSLNSSGDSAFSIFADRNLSMDFNNLDTNNLNLGFDVNAFYLWNIPANVPDANYFVCYTLRNIPNEINISACTEQSIMIDSTAPSNDFNAVDANLVWSISDLNINFSCTDNNSGCNQFFYSVDDSNFVFNWGADQNIGVPVTNDGNTIIFFHSSDVADTNSLSRYINAGKDVNGPTIGDRWPFDDESSETIVQIDFVFNVLDSEVGPLRCWYGRFTAGILDQNNSADVNSDGWCTVTSAILATGQNSVVVIHTVTDHLDNNNNLVWKSGTYTHESAAPPSGTDADTGGGGGGVTPVISDIDFTPKQLDVFFLYAPFTELKQTWESSVLSNQDLVTCNPDAPFECEIIEKTELKVSLDYDNDVAWTNIVGGVIIGKDSRGKNGQLKVNVRVINLASYFELRSNIPAEGIFLNPFIFKTAGGTLVGIRIWWIIAILLFISALVAGGVFLAQD